MKFVWIDFARFEIQNPPSVEPPSPSTGDAFLELR